MKRLIVDIDNTISFKNPNETYENATPDYEMRDKLNQYFDTGFEIVFFTSRNMKTFQGNVGKINVHTLPQILDFLDKNDFRYNEVLVGKPWCGEAGFYIDDRALRPKEFKKYTYKELLELIQE